MPRLQAELVSDTGANAPAVAETPAARKVRDQINPAMRFMRSARRRCTRPPAYGDTSAPRALAHVCHFHSAEQLRLLAHNSQAPLLPPVRKQFAAPSSAKPAASAEASTVVLAESVIQPRHKSAYVRFPAYGTRLLPWGLVLTVCVLLQLTICVQTLFAEARRAELKEQKPEFQVSELTKVRPSTRAL